jgi:hypothetical protein
MQKSRVVIYFFALLVVGIPADGAQNPPPAAVLPPDPVVGAWKLNLAKSSYVTPAPKSMTVTIAPAERGYAFTIDAVGPDGQPQKWGYISAFDGAESPVTGNPAIDAVIASTTGSGTTVRYKKGGSVITTTTSTVSDDGKTLFVTMKIPLPQGNEITNVAVYDRQ